MDGQTQNNPAGNLCLECHRYRPCCECLYDNTCQLDFDSCREGRERHHRFHLQWRTTQDPDGFLHQWTGSDSASGCFAHSDTNAFTHSDTGSKSYRHAIAHSETNTFTDGNTGSKPYRYAIANCDSCPYSYSDTCSYGYAFSYCNPDPGADGYAFSKRHSFTHPLEFQRSSAGRLFPELV
jgi:hypothetical protein